MADEQHIAEPGDQLVDVERLTAERRLGPTSTPSGSHASWAVWSARSLGARQAGVDRAAQPRQRLPAASAWRMPRVGQRPLVVGKAVGRLGVSEQPQHRPITVRSSRSRTLIRESARLAIEHGAGRSDRSD